MTTGNNRPLITLTEINGLCEILHNGTRCKVSFQKYLIKVGCTDISVEAAEFLLKKQQELFKEQPLEIVYQQGLI
jgi:hypothetical protein